MHVKCTVFIGVRNNKFQLMLMTDFRPFFNYTEVASTGAKYCEKKSLLSFH